MASCKTFEGEPAEDGEKKTCACPTTESNGSSQVAVNPIKSKRIATSLFAVQPTSTARNPHSIGGYTFWVSAMLEASLPMRCGGYLIHLL